MRDLCEATKEASVICVNVLLPLSPQPSLFLHGYYYLSAVFLLSKLLLFFRFLSNVRYFYRGGKITQNTAN